MNIMNAFPTPVGFFDVIDGANISNDVSSLNKGLTDFIYSIKHEDSPQRSMFGGYHTNEDLLSRDNHYIQQFHKLITSRLKEYYKKNFDAEMGPNTKMVSWGMIYGKNHHSVTHNHAGADLSSAYYCKVPSNLNGIEGNFVVGDPRPAAKYDRNYRKGSSLSILPKEGLGIIFPGWLEHHTIPHNSDEDRICITTNVFIDHGTFFK